MTLHYIIITLYQAYLFDSHGNR